ncbi:LysR family transcriptional regulator [Vibrio sp. S4M6]|uniref:LysR family transcriptional regulator n=1 Tax=Vibrio sinus TaxID=2946865 RepID=UPI00202AB9A6|nr:LysR family transcriptional regulator [Vibrio sinus]MCL9783395.1 LysR family transcriptional regulator [Vibrio sinus]
MNYIDELPYFLAVEKYLSFSKAATQLGCANSTVSRKIASLEGKLETSLFTRSTRNVMLTESGQELYKKIIPTLTQFDDIFESIKDANNQSQGSITISCPALYANLYLSRLLPDIREKWPNIDLKIITSEDYVDLTNDEADICIRVGRPKDENFIAKKLADVRYWLVASKKYINENGLVDSLKNLEQHNHIMLRMKAYHKKWKFTKEDITNEITITRNKIVTNNVELQINLVEKGLGVGLFMDRIIYPYINQGKLERVLDSYAITPNYADSIIYIAFTRDKSSQNKVRVIVDYLFENLKKIHASELV